jgi:hypothetical protein
MVEIVDIGPRPLTWSLTFTLNYCRSLLKLLVLRLWQVEIQ